MAPATPVPPAVTVPETVWLGGATVSVKLCDAFGTTPLAAPMLIG